MSEIKKQEQSANQTASKNKNQQSPQPTKEESKPRKYPKPNVKVIIIAFITGVSLSILLQRYICQNWELLAPYIFTIHTITDQLQRLTILKQSMTLIATFQLIITMMIMSIRVLGQKISPVGEKDPLIIAVLNRILNNNIEQIFVFFGIYSYLLLSTEINLEMRYIFALPLLFLIGRLLYFVSYLAGSFANVSSFRTLGFAFVFGLGYLMIVEIILNKTNFMRIFLFA